MTIMKMRNFFYGITVCLGIFTATQAEAANDCNFKNQISDNSRMLVSQQAETLSDQINNLISRYDIKLFVCLSNVVPSKTLDDHVDDTFSVLQMSGKTSEESLLIYINTNIRRTSFKSSGSLQTNWGETIMPTLKKYMRSELAENNYGNAVSMAIDGLEAEIFRPMRNADSMAVVFVSEFSLNVTTHAIIHELAHAVIREFEIPVLANEEDMADNFSTLWITQTRGEKAQDIIMDRVRSWILEDSQNTLEKYDFKGEHSLDIRRAFQTSCLFYGTDPYKNANLMHWLNFSDDDLADCSDTAPDQMSGWVNIVGPNLLPEGQFSKNVEISFGSSDLEADDDLKNYANIIANDLRRFDWPRSITLYFDTCDDGFYWNRTDRKITICTSYMNRFFQQGKILAKNPNVLVNYLSEGN